MQPDSESTFSLVGSNINYTQDHRLNIAFQHRVFLCYSEYKQQRNHLCLLAASSRRIPMFRKLVGKFRWTFGWVDDMNRGVFT